MSTVAAPSELQDPLYDRQITLPQLVELWESYPVKPASPFYLKIELAEGDASTPWDDQLTAEPFDTLIGAQGAFTSAKFRYARMYTLDH